MIEEEDDDDDDGEEDDDDEEEEEEEEEEEDDDDDDDDDDDEEDDDDDNDNDDDTREIPRSSEYIASTRVSANLSSNKCRNSIGVSPSTPTNTIDGSERPSPERWES